MKTTANRRHRAESPFTTETSRYAAGALLAALAVLGIGCRQESEYFGKVEPPPGNVFRFNNGAEPEYLDPGLSTDETGIRIAVLLFEGLTQEDPKTIEPRPGVAERWEISPDQLTYTFHLRRNALWSDGSPLTARDFLYSWTRVLDPKTTSRFAGQLYPIRNAEAFNQGRIKDPGQLGLRALDASTFEVRLEHPVPYFLHLTASSTYFPVPAAAVEQYGAHWTEPGHVVSNGPFVLAEHRVHDRFVLEKNPYYWNAGNVRLDRVSAYSIEDLSTSANMYESGRLDWVPSNYVPAEYISYMRGRFRDLQSLPFLGIYYYLINVTRPPLDNPLMRRALNLAVDRRAITDELMRGGQIPTSHFVPLGVPHYESPPGPEYNPEEAKRLLAQAGYPNGVGLRTLEILFNTRDDHRKIAEAIQQMWAKTLNIRVTLRNEEFASYLKSTNNLEFDIARRGWIADYPDPTTFTDLMESTNGNNNTGWKNRDYDRLIGMARQETDPLRRMALLQQGEALLLAEMPVIPIYTYASNHLIKPYVRGIYASPMSRHPLNEVCIDRRWRERSKAEDGACD